MAASVSDVPGWAAEPGRIRLPDSFPSPSVAVGHDEQPFASVARADLGRAEDSARNAIAHCLQWSDQGVQLSVDVPRDVLAEKTRTPAVIKHPEESVDEPAVVGRTALFAGNAVGLAWVARSDAMNEATPRSSVEGSCVRPDRRRMNPPCLHARDQRRDRRGFPLHVTDASRSGFGNSDAKFQPADPGAEAEQMDGT